MTSFNHLQMAEHLAKDPRFEPHKTLLGLCSKTTYTPTQSKITCFRKECDITMGQKIEKLLKVSPENMAAMAQAIGKFEEKSLGNYMLEGLLSEDHAVVALCLYRYFDLRYSPVTDTVVMEGEAAKAVAPLF